MSAPANGHTNGRARELLEPARFRERAAMLCDGPEAIGSIQFRGAEGGDWIELSPSRLTDEDAVIAAGSYRIVGRAGSELAHFNVREAEERPRSRASSREIEALAQGYELVLSQARAVGADARAALEKTLQLLAEVVDRTTRAQQAQVVAPSPWDEFARGVGPIVREVGLAWLAQRQTTQTAAAVDPRATFAAAADQILARVPPDVAPHVQRAARDVLGLAEPEPTTTTTTTAEPPPAPSRPKTKKKGATCRP